MAQFFWKAHTDGNRMCIACMSQENDRGFVDSVNEITITRDDRTATGVADVWFCANCIEQMARMVGCASRDETMEMAFAINERDEAIEKLKGEIQAWQQRLTGLANLSIEDFDDLRRLERERLNVNPPPGLS